MKKFFTLTIDFSPLTVIIFFLVCAGNLGAQTGKTFSNKYNEQAFIKPSENIHEKLKKNVRSQIDESVSVIIQAKTDNSSLKSAFGLSAISESDSLVLVKLYNDTDGPNWTNKLNWLSDQPIRTWYGVTVVGDNVTEIKLKDNNLTGTIPAELGQLTSMEYLSLDTNNLSGNIPAELGNLTNLDYLYLSGNQLTGGIPSELGNLNNLILLYVAGNELSGTIPDSLGNLSALRWLDLAENELTGNIPVALGQLSALEYLDLSINQLSGSVPAELADLSALKWLALSTNQLSGTIPTEFGGMANLEMLYLDGNQLNQELPAWLNELTKLKWINLSMNLFSGPIPSGLSNLDSLNLLYLENNLITGIIPAELGQIETLQWLNLGQNQLAEIIPPELYNPNLSLLDLNNNQLTGSLPPALGLMTNLEWLFLNSNKLTGSIPLEISEMVKLKYLEIQGNEIGEIPDLVVPASVSDLIVSDNKLSFEDLEYNMDINPSINFVYSPQDSIGINETVTKNQGDTFTYTLTTGGTQNIYKWYKDGILLPTQTSETIEINNISSADEGVYYCEVTNNLVTGLTLTSREIELKLNVCIKLKFDAGWNIFSLPVMPANADMENIFQPFITSESMIKMQDELGNALEDRGIFGGWTNSIGDLTPTEGYVIKMKVADSIQICGSTVEYPFAIPLKKGWNIINYPHMEEFSGLEVVQQLIDSEVLIKVQDEEGNSIEDYGIYGDWTNNIGSFVPGEGYKIKVSEDDVLMINSSYPKSNSILMKSASSDYFKPVFEGNGINHMNINLVNLAGSGIKAGDEIGIFDGKICVGSAKVTDINSSKINLIASAGDGGTGLTNGFSNGNDIILRIYRDGKEFPVSLQPVNGTSLQFEKNGTLFAFANAELNTGITLSGNDFYVNLFPNPFQDFITMNINLPKPENLDVEIYDLNSRRIRQLYSGLASGMITLQWDGNDSAGNKVANGVYICRVNKTWKKVILNGN